MSNSTAYIYVGAWTNWSYGPILGRTLTLTRRDGNFFLVFLAVYVTLAATASWQIISFVLHQILAIPLDKPADGLHFQRQAILRNTRTPAGVAWELCQLGRTWRKRTRSPIRRTLPFGLLAISNLAGFVIASVFISNISSGAGDIVLIRSPECGFASFPKDDDNGWVAKLSADTTKASDYASSCYRVADRPNECNKFITKEIGWTMTHNVSCPFEESICRYSNTSAIQFDTGHIDSHASLGIGAARKDRISLRRVTTCSQLLLANYLNEEKIEQGFEDPEIVVKYNLGSVGTEFAYTFWVNRRAAIVLKNYNQESMISYAGDALSTAWHPIRELKRTDADVTVVLLTFNNVYYGNPIEDPLFSAHTIRNFTTSSGYVSDYDAAAVGCAEQYQFCEVTDSPSKKCTPLTASGLLSREAFNLFPKNTAQGGSAYRLLWQLSHLTMDEAVRGRGASAIRAAQTVLLSEQTIRLPENQWELELEGWFATGLADLQQRVVEYASGAQNLGTRGIVLRPAKNDTALQDMCNNQMVRDQGTHQNFSILGIVVVLVLGGVLIVLSLFIDSLVGWVQHRWGRGEYKRMSWTHDSFLYLQRQAYNIDSVDSGLVHGMTKAGEYPEDKQSDTSTDAKAAPYRGTDKDPFITESESQR